MVRAESITAQLQHSRLQFVALSVVAHPRGEAREDGEHLGAEGVVGAEGRFAEAELVVQSGPLSARRGGPDSHHTWRSPRER